MFLLLVDSVEGLCKLKKVGELFGKQTQGWIRFILFIVAENIFITVPYNLCRLDCYFTYISWTKTKNYNNKKI